MIAPRPWRRMGAITAWHIRIVPVTSTASSAVAASALMCSKPTVSTSSRRPAVFTSNVDPPVHRICLLDEANDRSLIGDVKLMGRGGTTRIDDLGHCRLGFPLRSPVADEHRGLLSAEPTRNGSTQHPATTGHKRNAPRKTMAVIPSRFHDSL